MAAGKRPSLTGIAAATLALLTLLGFGGRLHPALDSLGHFRLQFGVLLLVFAVALLARRRWRTGLGSAAGAALALFTVAPHLGTPRIGAAQATAEAQRPVYRLLQLNLRFDNDDQSGVLATIARADADVITLQEVSAPWRERLKLVAARYPHQLVCGSARRGGGPAILSRRPFAGAVSPVTHCPIRGMLAVAPVDLGGRAITVASLHLGWPWPHRQPLQLDWLDAMDDGQFAPDLLAGDFNAAPWSETARRVRARTRLGQVEGIGLTWLHHALPAKLRPWIGLPIDQIMTGAAIEPLSAHTLPDAGSDHAPLLLEFSVLRSDTPRDDAPVRTVLLGQSNTR